MHIRHGMDLPMRSPNLAEGKPVFDHHVCHCCYVEKSLMGLAHIRGALPQYPHLQTGYAASPGFLTSVVWAKHKNGHVLVDK